MMNYHHLRIFWTVAREGSLRAAAAKLHLTQPTMSTQIHQLEDSLGEPLFQRSGRKLILTAAGRMALEYAEEIFGLGAELQAAFGQGMESKPNRLNVGIVDSLPKLIARELLRPVFARVSSVRLVCHEGVLEDLALRLKQHRLDVLLTDTQISGEIAQGTFHHKLGTCGISLCAAPTVARRFGKKFPHSLEGAPFLLPTPAMPLRRELDAWFHREGIMPRIVAEFDDTALLKDFAADGIGIAPIHQNVLQQAQESYGLAVLGAVKGIRAEFYAVSVERKVKSEAILAITERERR